MQSNPPKYIAQLKHVRELALWGSANLSWWQAHLARYQLVPVEAGGNAQVIVTALDASWMGIPFRDLSVSVVVSPQGDAQSTGLFFASAFNASRFIVLFEEYWFHLPYQFRADLDVSLKSAFSFRLGSKSAPEIAGQLGLRDKPDSVAHPTSFVGQLFLPNRRNPSQRRWLNVKIDGNTTTQPFDPERDQFTVCPASEEPIVASLRDSQFAPGRWQHRDNATHARTKTFTEQMRGHERTAVIQSAGVSTSIKRGDGCQD